MKQMAAYSQAGLSKHTLYKRKRINSADVEAGNPIPQKVGDHSPIKYVFYIIKENRTYDQVLGDIKEGNGDTSLGVIWRKHNPQPACSCKRICVA